MSEIVLRQERLAYVLVDDVIKFKGNRVTAKRFAAKLHQETGFPLFVIKKTGKRVQWNPSAQAVRINKVAMLESLAKRVANLNPDAGEIGAGMLRQLVSEARAITGGKQ